MHSPASPPMTESDTRPSSPWRARLGRALTLALGVAAAACSTLSSAQTDEDGELPARVGRVALADGPVWLESAGNDGASVGQPLNWPLGSGDVVATGERGRAELSIGSTRLRLGADSRLRVLQLDDQAVELELQRGALALSIVSAALAREFSVVGSAGRIEPLGAGFYRFDIDADSGDGAASVWHGELRVRQGEASLRLASGQRAELYRDGGWRLGALQRDAFARWAEALDASAPLPAGLSAEMTGADSLASHGEWRMVDEWGLVWFPRLVIADWAPYRYGRWARIEPWGWTWIDDAPWGFATSHYGRWVLYLGRWCWLPGPSAARPAYAPALVDWRDGYGAAIVAPRQISPGVRWLPLAPHAPYVPAWRRPPTTDRPAWRDERRDDWRRDHRDSRDTRSDNRSDNRWNNGSDRRRTTDPREQRGRNEPTQPAPNPVPLPAPAKQAPGWSNPRATEPQPATPRSPLLEPVIPQPRSVPLPWSHPDKGERIDRRTPPPVQQPAPQPIPQPAPPATPAPIFRPGAPAPMRPQPPEVRPQPAAPAASHSGGGRTPAWRDNR